MLGDWSRAARLGKGSLNSVHAGRWMGLFLRQPCALCDRTAAQIFCLDCQRQLFPAPGKTSDFWGIPALSPQQLRAHDFPVAALGIYGGALKRAILSLKYGDRPDIAGPLGEALARRWLAAPRPKNTEEAASAGSFEDRLPKLKQSGFRAQPCSCYVLPIPLHRKRLESRGYNQAELIARSFCQFSRLPLLKDGLMRVADTQPQHQLTLVERQYNLGGAFEVGVSLRRRKQRETPIVLLIDDIYTTGTTAHSAAQTLAAAGVKVLAILAAARATL